MAAQSHHPALTLFEIDSTVRLSKSSHDLIKQQSWSAVKVNSDAERASLAKSMAKINVLYNECQRTSQTANDFVSRVWRMPIFHETKQCFKP
jgi:hypothetical protein